jgi:5-aminopentanamidase
MTHRLALLQCPSPAGDIEAAFATLGPALRAAGAAGAQMLVAPETLLPGYNSDRISQLALPAGGDWQDRLAAMCKTAGCGLTLGYAERSGAQVYNAAVSLDARGATLAQYRKIQLYGEREAAIYTPGSRYVTFEFHGAKAALLICYDVEFAPHSAALAAQGVTLILVPTANMVPFTHVCTATVPAMAANHGLSIVYANYCGSEGDLTYCGRSLIAGPHGEILAQAGETPALLIADLPLREPARLSTQKRDYRPVTD